MKRIEAIVRQHRLAEVKLALAAVPHRALTACDVKEEDAEGVTLRYRSTNLRYDMASRSSIWLLVEDADAQAAVDAILGAADTGREGDGMIVVVPVDEVVQISHTSAAVA